MVGMKGFSIIVPSEQKTNLWIIENMFTGQIYTIDIDTKQCQKSTNTIQPVGCLPRNLYNYLNFVSF